MSAFLKGWRTILVNAITLILALLAYFDPSAFDPETKAILLGLAAALNIVLRFLTDTPVGEKKR